MPSAVATLLALGMLVAAPQFTLMLSPQPLTAERVQQWAEAVETHDPGRIDEAAQTINRWSADDLYMLFSELRALEAFQKNPLVKRDPANRVRYPSPKFEKNIHLLLRLTPDERRTGNINRLLLRAALLHTDVQLLAAPLTRVIVVRSSPFSGLMLETSQDGRRGGVTNSAAHVEFASWLLDGIRRDISVEGTVRSWYETVAAHLQYSQRDADALWLLDRGRRLFPDDMVLLFLSGTLHETRATPRVQAGFRRSGPIDRRPIEAEHDLDELKLASGYLTRAIDIYPGYFEARLHLGRVASLMDNHQRAIELLSAVAARATLPEHRYYSALFLARAYDAAGNLTAAREHLERASEAFPQAQSPLLALSELARRQGDSAGARRPLERLLAMPVADERQDPYWWYSINHVGDAPARLEQWRDLVTGTRR